MQILKGIPEVVKGTLLIVAGLSLLLHTLGVFTSFFWWVLIIMSVLLIIVGFSRIGGVKVVKVLCKKEDNKVIIEEEKE